jgi:hypothetical protein
MAERLAKRARVQRLRSKLPYVSQSALSALLKAAQSDEGLPDITSRRSIGKAKDSMVNTATPYGPLHQQVSISRAAAGAPPQHIEIQNPFAMLYHVCLTCGWYAELLASAMAAKPCTVAEPWSLVLYTDEILPGNQLGYKGARKMWGFYWHIMELGPLHLSDEVLGMATWCILVRVHSRCTRPL